MKLFSLGFKSSLLIAISLLLSLCLTINNIYSYQTFKKEMIDNLQSSSLSIVNNSADKIQQYIDDRSRAINEISKIIEEQPHIISSNIEDRDIEELVHLSSITKKTSNLKDIVFVTDDGFTYGTIVIPNRYPDGVVPPDVYDGRTGPWYSLGKKVKTLIIQKLTKTRYQKT